MSKDTYVTLRNQSFNITTKDIAIKTLLDSFSKRTLTTYKIDVDRHGNKRKVVDGTYYIKDRIDTAQDGTYYEYFFPKSIFTDLIELIKRNNIDINDLCLSSKRDYQVEKLNLNFNNKFQPLPHQIPFVEALTSEKAKSKQFVDLDTGKGKTFIAMYSLVKLNMRTMIMLPRFLEKWYDDVFKYTDVKEEDVFMLAGYESLYKLMTEPCNYKFIIASMTTLDTYIKEYNKTRDFNKYPVAPHMLMQHLKIGSILNDETHMQFNRVFNNILYFDTYKFIGLSATLITKDKGLDLIYNILFPENERLSSELKDKGHINVFPICYRFNKMKGLNWTQRGMYNHGKLEQSIIKFKDIRKFYLEMIYNIVNEKIMKVYKKTDKDKFIIYASTVDMCDLIVAYFKHKQPNLDVKRYVAQDPYSNILESTLTVTTPMSGGTAIDVPNLIGILNTVSILSAQANNQIPGRLRNIPDRDLVYMYIFCKDIRRQIELHKGRIKDMSNKTKTVTNTTYNIIETNTFA